MTPPYFLGIFALLMNVWYHVLYGNPITWHLLILPHPSWQAKLKQMLWVTEAWTYCCHKNSLSLCFLSLPLGHPPNPQLPDHDIFWFFSWPLSKRLRKIQLHLMKQLDFTSLRVPQSHSSNIVLIKQFLIFYNLFLRGRRELSSKPRAEARMSSWETELCVMFTAIICSLSAQQRAGISFQTRVCSTQPRQPPLKCSWFAFVDTSSVSVGADERLSRLLSTFSAATRGSALLICCFATHHHSWDTLLKELPAPHSLLQTSTSCVVVFMFFTPVTQAAVEHSWSLLCWGGKHICDSTGAPSPAQLHHSWWQCHSKPGTAIPAQAGAHPSLSAADAGGAGCVEGKQKQAGWTCFSSQLPTAQVHLHLWKSTKPCWQRDRKLFFWELHVQSWAILLQCSLPLGSWGLLLCQCSVINWLPN